MDLNAALILVRIVDKGSFTAAAQELGMTKATVSRRIAGWSSVSARGCSIAPPGSSP
jgi:DNA-binding transcriptional regulator YdaS (Cro superfamily)